MCRPYVKTYRICAGIIGLLAWLGITLQLYTALQSYLSKGRTIEGALVEFFSFFTIQCNLLVAISLTVIAIMPTSKQSFFKMPGVITAITVYISVVSLVYNLVLRPLYHFTGLTKLGDELVHLIVPVLYIIYWLTAVLKEGIAFKNTFKWLWYPFFYLVYVLIRGAISNLYPYFFLNAGQFGYGKVFLNITMLMVVFLGFSMLYVLIARLISSTNQA